MGRYDVEARRDGGSLLRGLGNFNLRREFPSIYTNVLFLCLSLSMIASIGNSILAAEDSNRTNWLNNELEILICNPVRSVGGVELLPNPTPDFACAIVGFCTQIEANVTEMFAEKQIRILGLPSNEAALHEHI